MRVPTSHDVAIAAGVSQSTVSRALRGDHRVAAATRQRVAEVADELGYVSSDRGRGLSTRRTGRTGVVVEDLNNPFYLELLDALHHALELSQNRMVVFTPQHDDRDHLTRLVDGSIDGVILTTTLLTSSLPQRLRERGLPFVLLNRVVDDPQMLSCSVDNVRGAEQIGAAIVDRGHREIAAIFGPSETSTGRDREAGFRRALSERKVELPDRMIRRCEFTYDGGHREMRELLHRDPRPTAVFCGNDVVALGAINAAHAASVRIPQDLSIVGFDDIGMASWDVFRLTTVRQDTRHMTSAATDLLLAQVADPDATQQSVVLPARVIERSTLGAPPRGG